MNPNYDAVIVPGGGVTNSGEPSPWVKTRLNAALAVEGSPYIITLSLGTPYKPPPLNAAGFPISEAQAGAEYLLTHGCDGRRLLTENVSLDTIGNAYFLRTIHTDPMGIGRLLVITSAFHMPRIEAIFRWVYSLAPQPHGQLDFQQVPDEGMDAESLQARYQKEQQALSSFRQDKQRASCATLAHLHAWLFSCHQAYMAAGKTLNVSEKVRETY